MKTSKNLLASIVCIASATLGSFGYAAWTDNILPIENLSTVASCSEMGKMYLNQDNDNDGKSDYYLYLNNNFILNGAANNYTAGQILRESAGVTYTKVKYYRPLANMIYKVDINNVPGTLDNSTFWRASRVFPYNTPIRGIATTPNKIVFEQPSDNDANKNMVSFVYDYRYKYAQGFDGTTNSAYRYNQVPNMGYMDNIGLSFITTLPGSEGNRKRSWSAVQSLSNCKNYELHRCGNGTVETPNAGYMNQFVGEQCDGTVGVPAGYICTSSCTLKKIIVSLPSCTLTVNTGLFLLGSSAHITWAISGNYTNTPQLTYTPTTWNINGLPYTVPTANGTRTIIPQHTGLYNISMTVSNSAGQKSCNVVIAVHPAPQLQCTLTLSPNPVYVNQIASVGWNVTGGNFVGTYIYVNPAIIGSWPHWVNANQYNGVSSVLPTQTGNYLFSMTVNNPNSSAICTGILNVISHPNPTCALTTITPVIISGQTATLNGSYTNATLAGITPTIGGLNFIYPNWNNTNISVAPTSTTTYIMVVTGQAGTTPAICQTTITVNQQPSCALTTTTPVIISGQTATLNGSYTNATLAGIIPTIGGLNFIYPNWNNTNISVAPTTTTTYTLVVTGQAGTTPVICQTTITVNQQPTCALTTTTPVITSGQTALLNGSYTNATLASFTPTIGGLNFIYPNWNNTNISVAPTSTTTYTLVVTGQAGTTPAICQTTITVTGAAPSCILSVAPTAVSPGDSVNIGRNVFGIFGTTQITNTPLNTIIGIPYTIAANNNSGSIVVQAPNTSGTYLFAMNVANSYGTSICTGMFTVQTNAQLQLTKTLINNILYHSGDLVSFRIDFANIGNITANHVVLTDRLPAALTYESSQIYGVAPITFGTGINGNNILVEYSGFSLIPGQTGYMIVTGKLKGYNRIGQTLNNVFLDSDETDQLYAAALFFMYTPSANATITKISDKPLYYPSEDVQFTIAVTNNGPDIIDNVQIIDLWPTNNNSCLTIDTNRLSNASLPVGQIVNLYLTGHIANNPSCVGTYINNVDLEYTINGLVKTGHADATIKVLPTPSSTMTIDKNILQYGNNTGDPVSFELIYYNNGTATISNYDIVDYWPGTLNFVSASPMPITQTATPGGQLLHWIFNTPLAPNGSGRIVINGIIN